LIARNIEKDKNLTTSVSSAFFHHPESSFRFFGAAAGGPHLLANSASAWTAAYSSSSFRPHRPHPKTLAAYRWPPASATGRRPPPLSRPCLPNGSPRPNLRAWMSAPKAGVLFAIRVWNLLLSFVHAGASTASGGQSQSFAASSVRNRNSWATASPSTALAASFSWGWPARRPRAGPSSSFCRIFSPCPLATPQCLFGGHKASPVVCVPGACGPSPAWGAYRYRMNRMSWARRAPSSPTAASAPAFSSPPVSAEAASPSSLLGIYATVPSGSACARLLFRAKLTSADADFEFHWPRAARSSSPAWIFAIPGSPSALFGIGPRLVEAAACATANYWAHHHPLKEHAFRLPPPQACGGLRALWLGNAAIIVFQPSAWGMVLAMAANPAFLDASHIELIGRTGARRPCTKTRGAASASGESFGRFPPGFDFGVFDSNVNMIPPRSAHLRGPLTTMAKQALRRSANRRSGYGAG